MGQVQSLLQPYLGEDGPYLKNVTRETVREFIKENRWKLAAGCAVGWAAWRIYNYPRNLPPGPWGLPIVGAVHQIGPKFYEDFTRLGKQYGDIYSICLLGKYVTISVSALQ